MKLDVSAGFYAVALWYSLMTRIFDGQANVLRLGESNTGLDVLAEETVMVYGE
jgi:hypothetical protein